MALGLVAGRETLGRGGIIIPEVRRPLRPAHAFFHNFAEVNEVDVGAMMTDKAKPHAQLVIPAEGDNPLVVVDISYLRNVGYGPHYPRNESPEEVWGREEYRVLTPPETAGSFEEKIVVSCPWAPHGGAKHPDSVDIVGQDRPSWRTFGEYLETEKLVVDAFIRMIS